MLHSPNVLLSAALAVGAIVLVLVFRLGRGLPVSSLVLAVLTGLAASGTTLGVSILDTWSPAHLQSTPWIRSAAHPAVFVGGILLIALVGVNWLGRAWQHHAQGGFAVFGRGLVALAHFALAGGLLLVGMLWIAGQMGDPGPREYERLYGSGHATGTRR